MKRILLALHIICVFFCSCSQTQDEKKRLSIAERQRLKTKDSLALKVAVMPTSDCFPVFIAKDRNLFDTTKVDVRLRGYNSQMDCDTALSSGSVEGSFSDLMRTERLRRKGVALDYETSTMLYWQLVSNKKARINKVSQLGNKTIGMSRYSATDYLCDQVLESINTSSQTFRIQVNDVNIRFSMLRNNELDAAWMPEPYASVAMRSNKCIHDSRKNRQCLGVLAFRTSAMKDRRIRTQIDAFIKGYNAACDSINKYGISHYADLLSSYCKINKEELSSIKILKYEHAHKPTKSDILTAEKYAKNTK